MLEEHRLQRMLKHESEIGIFCYERFQLGQQIELCQKRIAEIDRLVASLEGALRESEQCRRDIATQDALDKTKTEEVTGNA